MKKLFGILLILVTMLCLLPVTASAANPESDFKYSFRGPASVQIDKYVGHSRQVVIPNTIEGKRVRFIGAKAFEGNRSIFSVKLPENLTRIESDAFKDCTELKVVLFQDCKMGIEYKGNVFDRVGGKIFPTMLVTPRYFSRNYFPDEGKNVEWLGGRFDVIRIEHHTCQDKFPIDDGKCDICGKGMKPAGFASTRLGNAVKAAATVGETAAKNAVKALIMTTWVIRNILKLF